MTMDISVNECMIQDMRNMKSDFEGTYYPLLSMISDVNQQLECLKKDAVLLRNDIMKKDEIINDILKNNNNNIMEVSDDIKVTNNEIKELNDIVMFLWKQKTECKSLSSTLDTDESTISDCYSEGSGISNHFVKSSPFLNIDDRFITIRKIKNDEYYIPRPIDIDVEEDEKHVKHFLSTFIFCGTQLHRWKLIEELRKAQLEQRKKDLEEKSMIEVIVELIKEMI